MDIINPPQQSTPYEIKFFEIVNQLTNTFIKKNKDYGSAVKKNYDTFEQFGHNEGLKYIVGRISEKYQRLINLTFSNKSPEVNDESIYDTLLDMANYAILASISFDEHNPKNDSAHLNNTIIDNLIGIS